MVRSTPHMFHSVHSQECGELLRGKLQFVVGDELLEKILQCRGMS